MIHKTQNMSFLYNESKTELKNVFFSDPSHCHPTAVCGNRYSSNARRTLVPPVGNKNVSLKLYYARDFYYPVFTKKSIFCKYSVCVANFNKPFFKFTSNDPFNQLLVGLICGFQFFLV